MGPTLIFDKSALQALNVNESVWLDTFFICNITPIFWVEVLADLEKSFTRKDKRSAEDVVGNLALKTPEWSAKVNVHHESLIASELLSGEKVVMGLGQILLASGCEIELGGKKGVVFQPSPEEEAFTRWQNKDFFELERLIAKDWRARLSVLNLKSFGQLFQRFIETDKPKNITQARQLAEFIIDFPEREATLSLCLSLVGISSEREEEILERWRQNGCRPMREFAPYFSYVALVEMTFYIAIASGLISSERPSHKIDLSYLYYLPFCMVFASEDKLHALLAPIFMQEFQTFIRGKDLKLELKKLNEYYSTFPESIKKQGTARFAANPPKEEDFLITKLWDKYLPRWRADRSQHSEGKHEPEHLKNEKSGGGDWSGMDSITIVRSVYTERGDWKRVSSETARQNKEL